MKLRMNQCDEVNPFDGEVEVPDHVGHLLLSVAAGATRIELPEILSPMASPASAMWRTLMLSRIPRLHQHLDLQFLRCRPSNGLWWTLTHQAETGLGLLQKPLPRAQAAFRSWNGHCRDAPPISIFRQDRTRCTLRRNCRQ